MEDEQTGGMGSFREKTSSAKDGTLQAKDTVVEKGRQGFSAVKDAAMTAKEAVTAFTDEAKKQDLQGSTKEAVQKIGEASREVGQTAKDEVQQTKESMGSSSTDSSRS